MRARNARRGVRAVQARGALIYNILYLELITMTRHIIYTIYTILQIVTYHKVMVC